MGFHTRVGDMSTDMRLVDGECIPAGGVFLLPDERGPVRLPSARVEKAKGGREFFGRPIRFYIITPALTDASTVPFASTRFPLTKTPSIPVGGASLCSRVVLSFIVFQLKTVMSAA